MSSSKYVKDRGFASLQHVAREVGVTRYRLARWYKYEPLVFALIVDGLQWQQLREKMND